MLWNCWRWSISSMLQRIKKSFVRNMEWDSRPWSKSGSSANNWSTLVSQLSFWFGKQIQRMYRLKLIFQWAPSEKDSTSNGIRTSPCRQNLNWDIWEIWCSSVPWTTWPGQLHEQVNDRLLSILSLRGEMQRLHVINAQEDAHPIGAHCRGEEKEKRCLPGLLRLHQLNWFMFLIKGPR